MGGAEAPDLGSSKVLHMYRQRSLISELEDAIRRGTQEKRTETLRRITNLFLGANEQLNEEQIEVFDQVLGHLISRIESIALIDSANVWRRSITLGAKPSTRWRATMKLPSLDRFYRCPIVSPRLTSLKLPCAKASRIYWQSPTEAASARP
jgi:hypothetical protein